MRLILVLFLLLSSCQYSNFVKATKPNAAEEAIAKGIIQGAFDHIWGGVDSTAISIYHTPDFIILEHGEIWDNERIKTYIRSQLKRENRPTRINRMDFISIEKYGKSMHMAYHNYAEFVRNDSLLAKAQWLESALAVKTKEGWRLKQMHSTRVPLVAK